MVQPVAIDLFAGSGGFSLGFEMAGFSVPVSLEIDTWACDTLRYNHSQMQVIQGDIRDFNTPSSIIINICPSQPDNKRIRIVNFDTKKTTSKIRLTLMSSAICSLKLENI